MLSASVAGSTVYTGSTARNSKIPAAYSGRGRRLVTTHQHRAVFVFTQHRTVPLFPGRTVSVSWRSLLRTGRRRLVTTHRQEPSPVPAQQKQPFPRSPLPHPDTEPVPCSIILIPTCSHASPVRHRTVPCLSRRDTEPSPVSPCLSLSQSFPDQNR